MSTAELNGIKLNLISWINQLADKDVISFLDGIRLSRANNDWWNELNEIQKKQILKGIKDSETGKVMESKEFWKKLKNA